MYSKSSQSLQAVSLMMLRSSTQSHEMLWKVQENLIAKHVPSSIVRDSKAGNEELQSHNSTDARLPQAIKCISSVFRYGIEQGRGKNSRIGLNHLEVKYSS